jgi:hypothetical protein
MIPTMGTIKAVVLILTLAASANAFSPSYRPLTGRIGTTRSDATVLSKNLFPIGSIEQAASLSNRLQVSSVPIQEDFQSNPLTRVKNLANSFANSMKTNEVSQWRAVFTTFFASTFIFRGAIDSKLAEMWTFLMTSHSVWGRMFRSDHYEWMLAVGAFSIWIHSFWYADRAVRKASEQGRVHPWRKFRLQDRFEADKQLGLASGAPSLLRAPLCLGRAGPTSTPSACSLWCAHHDGSCWRYRGRAFSVRFDVLCRSLGHAQNPLFVSNGTQQTPQDTRSTSGRDRPSWTR